MKGKCALIVDDSRTARHFLARILERYEVRVEMAGSAEEALEFLGRIRPDVIFMDHMMPGMDGFQAVSAIKANPATATIPIMMYTSQAGELYVSQARALGAIGVLPKQIKPVEIEELLRTLHLVPAASGPAPVVAGNGQGADDVRRALKPADWDDLHRWLREMLQHHADGLRSDVETIVDRLLDAHLAESPAPPPPDTVAQPRGRPGMTAFLVLALAALAAVFFWLHLDTQQKWRAAAAQNAELLGTLEARRLAEAENAAGIREYLDAERSNLLRQYEDFLAALEWSVNRSAGYAPGTMPLNDERLEIVSGLLQRLREVGFSGVLKVQVHAGDFCLVSAASGEWVPAPARLSAVECPRFGWGGGDTRELQSVAFANFRAEMERDGGQVRLVVEELGDSEPLAPYPPSPVGLTAGEWNRVADLNNRVQVQLVPDTDLPTGAWPAASRR